MSALNIGAAAFGAVIGWMVHRILAHKEKADWSDIATVIATVGGAAVLSLFPVETVTFGAYALGLFAGFFVYFIIFVAIARAGKMPWLDILTGKSGISIMRDEQGPLGP